jgi:DNA-binding IclR family transcriptional regulator
VAESAAGAEEETPARGSQSIAAVERALDVLLLFSTSSAADLGVTEIAADLGMSKAAVHRILTSLRSRDLVTVDAASRRYALGPGALGLGQAYLARMDLRRLAAPELAWLSGETGETATLSIRTGDQRMYIDQVVPAREVRMEVQVGAVHPLHAGASSKAFLAYLPEADVEDYIARTRLSPVTAGTITDPEALRQELRNIRLAGYAVSLGERQAGACSVAAPIRDAGGLPLGVISVSGPIERLRGQVDECAGLLVAATRRLSGRMGFRGV